MSTPLRDASGHEEQRTHGKDSRSCSQVSIYCLPILHRARPDHPRIATPTMLLLTWQEVFRNPRGLTRRRYFYRSVARRRRRPTRRTRPPKPGLLFLEARIHVLDARRYSFQCHRRLFSPAGRHQSPERFMPARNARSYVHGLAGRSKFRNLQPKDDRAIVQLPFLPENAALRPSFVPWVIYASYRQHRDVHTVLIDTTTN